MIDFNLTKVDIDYLSCAVYVKVTKRVDPKDINSLLKFYLFYDNKQIQLDSSNYYTFNLPENKTYYDQLLHNDQEIRFQIFIPELLKGIKVKIRAILTRSEIIFWESKEIFLKTKEIDNPLFKVTNYYENGLKSKIVFEKELGIEQTSSFYLTQVVNIESNDNYKIAEKNRTELRDVLITYSNIKEFGSYKIKTRIYNINNNLILENVSYYIKLIEPLPLTYKEIWQPSSTKKIVTGNIIEYSEIRDYEQIQMINYRVRKPIATYYKNGINKNRIIGLKVKL